MSDDGQVEQAPVAPIGNIRCTTVSCNKTFKNVDFYTTHVSNKHNDVVDLYVLHPGIVYKFLRWVPCHHSCRGNRCVAHHASKSAICREHIIANNPVVN